MTKFLNRPLQCKIISVCVFANVIIFLVNIFLIVGINSMSKDMELVYQDNRSLNELAEALTRVQDSMTGYLSSKTSESLEDYYREAQNFSDLTQALNNSVTDLSYSRMERNIRNMSQNYLDEVAQTIEAKRGRNVEKYRTYYESSTRLYEDIEDYITSLNLELFVINSENYLALLHAFRRFEFVGVIVMTLVMIGNVLIVTSFVKTIILPLKNLADSANEVSEGNFDATIPPVIYHDEVGIVINAFGKMVRRYSADTGQNLLAVDIGGATTDVFSVMGGAYTRTVSANLGMSYSMGNVLYEAGTENIKRHLDFDISDEALRNVLRNKMIRPTIIPMTREDLKIEQAAAIEALRMSLEHHKSLARSLVGVQTVRQMGEIVDQKETGETLVQMPAVDLIIGSGGVLSHAPQREQAARMLIDAFGPRGITMLAVDSIFMIPHLGVLSSVNPEAAAQVFEKDCIVRLGHVISPVGRCPRLKGEAILEIDGREMRLPWGRLTRLELEPGEYPARLTPGIRADFGRGKGKAVDFTLTAGVCGAFADLRGL